MMSGIVARLCQTRSVDGALEQGGDLGGSQGAVSKELGRLEGVGETGGDGVRQLEQRGAVAFAGMAVAGVVISLITLWGHLF
jgi:hypothetical protein